MLQLVYLDPTFGDQGKVITFLKNIDNARINAIQQSDGKIVVADGDVTSLVLSRYNADGSLDDSFGSEGKVSTSFDLIAGDVAFSRSVSAGQVFLQSDGKLLAAVALNYGESFYNVALVRYNIDGSLDSTFGKGGLLDIFNVPAELTSFALQPDGKILMVGTAYRDDGDPFTKEADIAIARYNSDGSLDTSFGNGGKVSSDFGQYETANKVVLQADGKILVGGWSGFAWMFGRAGNFAVWRYNPDGSLDTSFGTGGISTTDFTGWNDDLSSLILQPDGKILAAGTTSSITGDVVFPDSDNNFALVRYNPDGSIDRSFGVNGKVISNFGKFENLAEIALQPDGKIIAVGRGNDLASDAIYDSSTEDVNDFIVARYNPDGSLDTTFGDLGKILVDGGSKYDSASHVLLQDSSLTLIGSIQQFNSVPTDYQARVLLRYGIVAPQPLESASSPLDFSQGKLGTAPRPIDFSQGKHGIRISGNGKWEQLSGTRFNDVLLGKQGKDHLFGQNGHDRLSGGSQADRLSGGGGNDRLLGEAGADYLVGGTGHDVLIGGAGVDVLTGGKGRDLFGFSSTDEGVDHITDFDPQIDQIDLRAIFKAPEFSGSTDFDRFFQFVQMAQQANQVLISIETSRVGDQSVWTKLVTLDNCAIETLNLSNFVIS